MARTVSTITVGFRVPWYAKASMRVIGAAIKAMAIVGLPTERAVDMAASLLVRLICIEISLAA